MQETNHSNPDGLPAMFRWMAANRELEQILAGLDASIGPGWSSFDMPPPDQERFAVALAGWLVTYHDMKKEKYEGKNDGV